MRRFTQMFINDWLHAGHFFRSNGYRPNRAVSLCGNEHSLFVGAFSAFVSHTRHVCGFAADIGFIQFDNAF